MNRDPARSWLRAATLFSILILAGCSTEEAPTGPQRAADEYLPSSVSASVAVLEVMELENLGGGKSEASDINDLDWIVGMSETADGQNHATLWQAGAKRDLTTEAGIDRATAVSNGGWVAGLVGSEAVRWSESGGTEPLGIPSGLTTSRASAVNYGGDIAGHGLAGGFTPLKWIGRWVQWQANGSGKDINDAGRMVGWARVDGDAVATLWAPNNWMDPLGALDGDRDSEAWGINNLLPAQIVGASVSNFGTDKRAFIIGDDVMTELPSLGGAGGWGVAYDINEAGYVVGASRSVPGGPLRATLWTPEGEPIDLGGLGDGSEDRVAYAINNKSTVVGISWISGDAHATLWRLNIPETSPLVLDTDTDGIVDGLDADPLIPSDFFSDEGLGGATVGTFITRGNQNPKVTEEPHPLGVRIKTYPTGGSWARASFCDGAATIWYGPGDEGIVTCGSVTAEAVSGTLDVQFIANNGVAAGAELPRDHKVTFIPETGEITADPGNSGSVLIYTESEEIELLPGKTFSITGNEDKQPPTIAMAIDPNTLWPPNHRMVLVADGISASDGLCDNVTLTVTVASDEPADGSGDGNTQPDFQIEDNPDGTVDVWVRAERAGNGDGRVYTITATATDCADNTSTETGTVTVPHDQGD